MNFLASFFLNETRHLWLRNPQLKIWRVFSVGILFTSIFALNQGSYSHQIKETLAYVVIYTSCLIYTIMSHPNAAEKQHAEIVQLYFRHHQVYTYIGNLGAHWMFLSIHLIIFWKLAMYAFGSPCEILTHTTTILLSTSFYIATLRQIFSAQLLPYQNFLHGFLVLPLTIPMLVLGLIHLSANKPEAIFTVGLSLGTSLLMLGIALFIEEYKA